MAALQGVAASGLNETDTRNRARCARVTADADAEGAQSMPAHVSMLLASHAHPARMHSMAHLMPPRSSAAHQRLSWSSRVASQDELGDRHRPDFLPCYFEMHSGLAARPRLQLARRERHVSGAGARACGMPSVTTPAR